jgi:uncharacterized Zn finger protein (UPF0148 family)
MALISCPECKMQISETALSCPHCGFILTPEQIAEIKEKYAREFYDSLEDHKYRRKVSIPQESKPKETLRPIIITIVLSVVLLLVIFTANYFSTYKTEDVIRYENRSNYLNRVRL